MRSVARAIAIGLLGALTGVATAAVAKDDEARVRQSLVRPEDGINRRIKGDLEMRVERDRERFEVKLRRADRLLTHDLYLEDAAGVLRRVGPFRASSSELKYRDRSRDGEGTLPLGVASLTEIVGRRLEVRIGSDVVLYAQVPGFDAEEDAKDRDDLDRTGAAPRKADARIRLRSRPQKGRERFEVSVKDLDLGRGESLHLWLEDPMNPGNLVDVGSLLADDDGDDRDHRFRRRTQRGQELPFGVGSVRDLGNLEVEVRDQAGVVLFEGTVPVLD